MSNVEFLRRYARPGRVGLVGGNLPIDKGIRFAQRHLHPEKKRSLWSHALLFQGDRADGQPWVIESDIEVQDGQVRNGVQENRIEKYADDAHYPNLAVLDFGIDIDRTHKVVVSALDFVVRKARYSVGGVFKTYWAIVRKQLDRDKEKDSTYCSSFIRTLYHQIGIDLAPGVAVRHTTPEHIAQTPVPHTRYLLVREGE